MTESPDWEGINLRFFTELPPDQVKRIAFQTVRSEVLDDSMPVILSGVLEKVYKDDSEQWWMDVFIDEIALIADIPLWQTSLSRHVLAASEGLNQPIEGVIEEPLEPQVKSFLLSDVIAPVVTLLPE